MSDGNAQRDEILALDDACLLQQCRTDRFRGTGRGGQKRNVTESAVRLTHLQTGVTAESDATRSQIHNRKQALQHLRREIAFHCRQSPPLKWTDRPLPGTKNPRYPFWLGAVLDALETCGFRVAEAAAFLDLSTGQLIRALARDSQLWQHVNSRRRQLDLPPLRQN
jgi:hypothetical protein